VPEQLTISDYPPGKLTYVWFGGPDSDATPYKICGCERDILLSLLGKLHKRKQTCNSDFTTFFGPSGSLCAVVRAITTVKITEKDSLKLQTKTAQEVARWLAIQTLIRRTSDPRTLPI
jgi:hypothetical protein